MKYHPIIMSASSVRGILAGTKTQTRRVVKARIPSDAPRMIYCRWEEDEDREYFGFFTSSGDVVRCPYGAPGDRLRIKETWRPASRVDIGDGPPRWSIEYRAGGHIFTEVPVEYSDRWMRQYTADPEKWKRWRSPIYMPRFASRRSPEIVSIRVERVQEITEADAKAEGADPQVTWERGEEIDVGGIRGHTLVPVPNHRLAFRDLWDEINAKRGYSWETSPWVWVIEWRGAE